MVMLEDTSKFRLQCVHVNQRSHFVLVSVNFASLMHHLNTRKTRKQCKNQNYFCLTALEKWWRSTKSTTQSQKANKFNKLWGMRSSGSSYAKTFGYGAKNQFMKPIPPIYYTLICYLLLKNGAILSITGKK